MFVINVINMYIFLRLKLKINGGIIMISEEIKEKLESLRALLKTTGGRYNQDMYGLLNKIVGLIDLNKLSKSDYLLFEGIQPDLVSLFILFSKSQNTKTKDSKRTKYKKEILNKKV